MGAFPWNKTWPIEVIPSPLVASAQNLGAAGLLGGGKSDQCSEHFRFDPSKAKFPHFQWCGRGQWGGVPSRNVTGEEFPNFPGVQEVKESPGTHPDHTCWFLFWDRFYSHFPIQGSP